MRDRPASADLHELLRRCIQCGLCLPHCATYLATGNEADSPRGRLLLLAGLDGAGADLRRQSLVAFDRCLGCHACETACPGGISPELLGGARDLALAEAAVPPPWLGWWLDSARGLSVLRHLAGGARGLWRLLAGRRWRERAEVHAATAGAARLLGSLPRAPDSEVALRRLLSELSDTSPDEGAPRPSVARNAPAAGRPSPGPHVAFFTGCAGGGLLPGTGRRTRRLLEAAGCRVIVPADQECCGALASHLGRARRRDDLRHRNRTAFATKVAAADHIVVEAAGCGLELKDYPGAIADRIIDAAVLLSRLELPPARPLPLRVALHDPCHALHGQGIHAEPRRLLRGIPGLRLLEPHEPEVCCGSGGAYSLRHRRLSAEMGRRKARILASTGAQLVVTSNPGCLGQIADGLALEAPEIPVLPLTDLLFYAHLVA